jgi:hypothetical protein
MKAEGKSLHHLKLKIIQLNLVFLNIVSWVASVENPGRDRPRVDGPQHYSKLKGDPSLALSTKIQ